MADPFGQLQIYLLGPPEVRLSGGSLTFPTRKTLALLIYLVVEQGQQPRELLAALLWPEASSERSRASLRNTLGHLQSVLRQADTTAQPPYLAVTHTTLALNSDANISLDLVAAEDAYALAHTDRSSRTPPAESASLPRLRAAAALHRGDFMAGFSLGDAPGFDDWITIQREVWRRRLGLIFDRLSEIEYASGELARAAETASHWIALDMLNEVAYRRKMRAHFAAGERGQALDTYGLCHATLAAELGVEPEPDTEALAARIRAQQMLQSSVPRPIPSDTAVAFLEHLFAGRSAEYQALTARYQRAAAGQLQVVMLRGEAGIGKTRLAQEFLAWAAAQGAETLHGRAFESGSRLSYQPIMEALRPLLGEGTALKDWLNLGEDWLAPLIRLMPALRDRYPDLSYVRWEAEGDRIQLFESLVQLTVAVAKRAPLVLFVDDLQWADSASLDLLQYAIRRWQESSSPILLLLNLRSEALHLQLHLHEPHLADWLVQLERTLHPLDLDLGPLSEQDTVQMVLSILSPPAPDFAYWIFHETHGHPFYLMETLKDLLERRALHPKQQPDGKWSFAVDSEHDLGQSVRVPSTVRSVIRSRLYRLSPNGFSLLVAGAVLEQHLTFERLCAVCNLSQDIGLPALDELLSNRLLVEAIESRDSSAYTLANDMIRDVVYTEAGDARRRLFHRRAVDLLDAANDSAAVLAHHAFAAGLPQAAFHYSLAAGQEALRLSAVNEAIIHFERARQLIRETKMGGPEAHEQIRELYTQLGHAYDLSGQLPQAQAVYAEWNQWVTKRS